MPSNSKIDKVKSKSKVHFDYAEPTQERMQNHTCLNYAERQGGRQYVNSEQLRRCQYRKAGLKEKAEIRSEKADFSIPFWNYFCTLSKFCYQKEQKLRKNNYLCAKIAT